MKAAEEWRADSRWRRLAMNHYRTNRSFAGNDPMRPRDRAEAMRRALGAVDSVWTSTHERAKSAPLSTDPDAGHRRWLDASRGRPVIFSDADLQRWRLVRDESGAVRLDKGERRPKRAAPAPVVAQSAAPSADHLDVIRGLLDWIDGRTLDPSIVIRAAKLVGTPAKVHAA